MPANPAIQAYADAVNAQFDVIEPAVDGVADDVAFLKEKIDALQNTPGTLTPEDQALLDAIQSRIGTLATRVTALDAATSRPTPPPTP